RFTVALGLAEGAPIGAEGGLGVAQVAALDGADRVEQLPPAGRVRRLLQRGAVERETLLGAALLAEQGGDAGGGLGRRRLVGERPPVEGERARGVAALRQRLPRAAREQQQRRVIDRAVAQRVAQRRRAPALVAPGRELVDAVHPGRHGLDVGGERLA